MDVTLQALRDLGYADGKNIIFELRHGDNKPERLPVLTSVRFNQRGCGPRRRLQRKKMLRISSPILGAVLFALLLRKEDIKSR
jgi:hypothetical protein